LELEPEKINEKVSIGSMKHNSARIVFNVKASGILTENES